MKHLTFMLCFLAILFTGGNALADCKIPSVDLTAKSSATSDSEIGQSFTATCTGRIKSITVKSNTDYTNKTVTVYQGEGIGGTVLKSISSNLVTGMNEISLEDAAIKVSAGSVYTFTLSSYVALKNADGSYDGGTGYMGSTDLGYDLYFSVTITSNKTLTVNPTNPGGSVTADSGDISSCSSSGGICSDEYTPGTDIVLTATLDTGYGSCTWTGCSSTSGNTCTVSSISDNTTVSVSYAAGGGGNSVALTDFAVLILGLLLLIAGYATIRSRAR